MDLLNLIYKVLPAYFANAVPVILGGGKPLDLGKCFVDGRRIFGDGKTIRGFISGLMAGSFVGFLQSNLFQGFLLSVGALSGDLLGSFIKRRLGMKRGSPAPLMDQTLFIIFAMLFCWPYLEIKLEEAILLTLVTIPIHLGTNALAYLLGMKDVPW